MKVSTYAAYSFGLGASGQLGLGSGEDRSVSEPTLVPGLLDKGVKEIACGDAHVACLTDSGEVYTFGSNDYGQLGRSRRIGAAVVVEALESHVITQVSCGQFHTTVLTADRLVFIFGRNHQAQLGVPVQDCESSVKSLIVKSLTGMNVVKIASGANHVLALADNGVVWSWGCGIHGQTGRGVKDVSPSPLPMVGLDGVPVSDISCGFDSSVILTVSGTVYSCGLGQQGQLGLNDTKDQAAPQIVSGLQGKGIVHVTCGNQHCIALSNKGEIYAWGNNNFGQLGIENENTKSILIPRKIDLFKNILRVQCGSFHTLVVVPSSALSKATSDSPHGAEEDMEVSGEHEVVFSFGQGNYGQLGNKLSKNMSAPQHVLLPKTENVGYILGAGNGYSIVAQRPLSEIPPVKYSYIHSVTYQAVSDLVDNVYSGKSTISNLLAYIEKGFSWPSSLNASFLEEDHYGYLAKNTSGVALDHVRKTFDKLLRVSQRDGIVLQVLNKALSRCLTKHNSHNTVNFEAMRFYLIIVESPLLAEVNKYNLSIFERLVNSIHSLPKNAKNALFSWWSNLSSEYFSRLTTLFCNFLTYLTKMALDERLAYATVQLLSILYEVNTTQQLIPYEKFYIPGIEDAINLTEYSRWRDAPTDAVFTYIQYPFFLAPEAKVKLLSIDAFYQKLRESFNSPLDPINVLEVRREFLFVDALDKLKKLKQSAFKKPMVVKFIGEEGIDEGGVTKEFFQLISEHLFEPEQGLFVLEEEMKYNWFNYNSTDLEKFYFAGIIFGLALYNDVQLNVNFPMVVYKKILESCPAASYTKRYNYEITLDDLKATFPTIGKNLDFLLKYEGDASDLDTYFQISLQKKDGKIEEVDLVESGGDIPLTNDNKQLYVAKYTDYMLNVCVTKQFESFKRGFLLVSGGHVLKVSFLLSMLNLKLLRAEELEKCIRGSSDSIDISTLQSIATYEGYKVTDTVIQSFWETVRTWSQDNKKRLLFFSTGSDRLPVGGLKSIKFVIQKNGPDSELLPTASTCYNTLLLPQYATKEKLRTKLELALKNNQGFGLR